MGIVQPPSGGLIGYSNYNLYDSCENLTGVSVTVNVTEQMVAIPSAPSAAGIQSNGIAFQLNCLPRAGGKITWQQYIMVVSRTGEDLRWGVNNWDGNPADTDGIIDQGGHLATLPSPLGAGYSCIPAGYLLEIALGNDADDNINAATFSMSDQNGAPVFQPTTVALTSLTDVNGDQVTTAELSPIVDIDFVIVGYANGANTTLFQGAGTITYRARNFLTVLNTFPPCTSGINTEESSNVTYGELGSSASAEIVQTFGAASISLGDPAALYATGANNQQHVFCQGSDDGAYNVFYDPGDNKIHGPERWASNAAGDPATLYATAANNQQHVFYRGADGGIYNVFYDPGDNSIRGPERWASNAAGDPATLYATAANNQQHVFYRGTDGGIYNVFYDPGDNKIHGPELWASNAADDPATLYATAANNQQHVFYRGADGGIYNVFYDPGDNKIHGPERWASNAAGDPATLYATAANNQQHVFYRGADGGIYNVFYDPGDNRIHGPERWASNAAGDPATLYATAANNQQHVFYRGADGGIYNVFYDPGDNKIHGPERWASNAAGDPATLYATAANNQQHVFYRGADGGIYNVFYDPGDNKIHGPERWA